LPALPFEEQGAAGDGGGQAVIDARSASLAAIVLMLSGPAAAALPDAAAKLRLVRLLLAQSPAVQRIPDSGNGRALQLLAEATSAFQDAERLSGQGQTQAAGARLDQALRQIVAASALVPDAAQRQAQVQRRARDLREALRAFEVLRRHLNGGAPGQGAEAQRIGALAGRAEQLLGGADSDRADQLLGQAEQALAALLATMATPEALVYGHHFATPAEEFAHELARNGSFEELVPIALAQLRTGAEAAALARQLVQHSRKLRASAQQQAAGGAFPAAIQTIQAATGHLQRALRTAGVIVPASTEGHSNE
jgi:hypothetical protein